MADSSVVTATSNPGQQPQSWLQQNAPPLIALITVAGGIYILGFCGADKAAIISPLVVIVLTYFFGTGAGSQAKDKVIAALKQKEMP